MKAIFARLVLVLCGVCLSTPAWSREEFKIAVFPDDQTERDLVLTGDIRKPDGDGPFAAVVLLHTCGGPSEHFTDFWPEYLRKIGYVSIAVDSFGPRGFRRCTRKLANIKGRDRDARDKFFARDAYGALDFLATLPYVDKRRVAVMGFSFGAITAHAIAGTRFRAQGEGDFKAAITLYGLCYRLKTPANMLPLLLIIGEKDRALKDRPPGRSGERPGCHRAQGRSKVEMHVLADTYHGFDNPRNEDMRKDRSGNKMLYSRQATETSKRLVKDFLARHL